MTKVTALILSLILSCIQGVSHAIMEARIEIVARTTVKRIDTSKIITLSSEIDEVGYGVIYIIHCGEVYVVTPQVLVLESESDTLTLETNVQHDGDTMTFLTRPDPSARSGTYTGTQTIEIYYP